MGACWSRSRVALEGEAGCLSQWFGVLLLLHRRGRQEEEAKPGTPIQGPELEGALVEAPHAWLGVGAAATLAEARRAFRALYAQAPGGSSSSAAGNWEREALRKALAAFEAQRRGPAVQLLLRKGGWHVELARGDVGPLAESVEVPDSEGARELARLVFQYDLRRGLTPTPAPLFCVAACQSRLENAATASTPCVLTAATCQQKRKEGPAVPPRCGSAPILRLPASLQLLVFARFLPSAGPGSSASQLARTCWGLAETVQSGDFWSQALRTRFRVVPCMGALAARLGPAPSREGVCLPSGLAAFAPGGEPGYVLCSPPPLTAEQLGTLALGGAGIGVGPGESLMHAAQAEVAQQQPQFLPAVVLAMTESGPTLLLLEPVAAGSPVLEFGGEIHALPRGTGGRNFFGGRHEVWIDMLETRPLLDAEGRLDHAPRSRLCVSCAKRGNEARWLRFCRVGEAPTVRLEVAFDSPQPYASSTPRLVLVADRDLPAFSELTWIDLHFCSSPLVRAAAQAESPEVQGSHTVPALQELQQLAELLRLQKRLGAFPGAEGAHAFIAL